MQVTVLISGCDALLIHLTDLVEKNTIIELIEKEKEGGGG